MDLVWNNLQRLICHKPKQTKFLFNPQILPLLVRVDIGVMAIKEYSIFPKALGLEPHHQFSVISRTLVREDLNSSAEMQSVDSTAPADSAALASWESIVLNLGEGLIKVVCICACSKHPISPSQLSFQWMAKGRHSSSPVLLQYLPGWSGKNEYFKNSSFFSWIKNYPSSRVVAHQE